MQSFQSIHQLIKAAKVTATRDYLIENIIRAPGHLPGEHFQKAQTAPVWEKE